MNPIGYRMATSSPGHRQRGVTGPRRSIRNCVLRLRLQLKRTHVAHGAARLRSRLHTLVGRQRRAVRINTIHRRNVVDSDAARAERVRRGRVAVVGKLSEVQLSTRR